MLRTTSARGVKCSYSKYVYFNYDYKKELRDYNGAYGTNELMAYFYDSSCNEKFIAKFIKDFRGVSDKYYNLRKLSIYAPFCIFDGTMIRDIVDAKSSYNDLSLNIFSFHSPVPNMWNFNRTLEKLSITMSDGIAYPNAGTDLLSTDLTSIRSIDMINNSPYKPALKVSDESKLCYTHGWGSNTLNNTSTSQ